MTGSRDFRLNEGTVRFADLVPSRSPFVGSARGVVEPDTEFSIVESRWTPTLPHRRLETASGFAVCGRGRRGAGTCPEYRCSVAEVLIAHTGRWRVSVGDPGPDTRVEVGAGDVMSVPAGAVRRIELLDEIDGFLFVVRSSVEHGDDVPAIATHAVAPHGALHPICSGHWIDDSGGIPVLRAVRAEDPAASGSTPEERAARWVCTAAAMQANPNSALASTGVVEADVIGPDVGIGGFSQGPIRADGRHGFCVRRITLESGAYVPAHRRSEPCAFLIQDGTLEVRSSAEVILLGAGDVLSMAPGVEHSLRNTTSRPTCVFVVLGAEDPAAPDFSSHPLPGRG